MASTINAAVGGVIVASDSSGALDVQTGGVNAIQIGTGQTVTISNVSVTTLTGTSATITNILDGSGNVRNIPSAGAAKTSAYTLTVSDIGEFVTVGTSGSITVPNDVFSAGNAVSIYNDTTGNVTITCSITTAYIAGTDSDKATMTLATRGVATVLFINPSLCVATGNLT